MKRRIGLGIGAALLAGGWGLMQNAEERWRASASNPERLQRRYDVWITLDNDWHMIGVGCMTVGAGVLAWSVPRSRDT